MASGLHEEFARDYQVEGASNKRFGLVVGAILLAFGCIRAYLHDEIGCALVLKRCFAIR